MKGFSNKRHFTADDPQLLAGDAFYSLNFELYKYCLKQTWHGAGITAFLASFMFPRPYCHLHLNFHDV